jgi:hypothetical protein
MSSAQRRVGEREKEREREREREREKERKRKREREKKRDGKVRYPVLAYENLFELTLYFYLSAELLLIFAVTLNKQLH